MKAWILALAVLPSTVAAQTSLISVPQVARSIGPVDATAPENIDAGRARSTQSDGTLKASSPAPPLLSRENVLACRRAQLGTPLPENVNCDQVMRRLAELSAERSAEGTLLNMLGERNTVTRPGSIARESGLNPDAIARQLSSGDVQGTGSNSDAAAIAVRQRSAPPSGSPR
jgi:hypothetical protein